MDGVEIPDHVMDDAIKELERVLPELIDLPDRAAVLAGAAVLDDLLSRALLAAFLPNPNRNDELFDDNGPLSTFSAKISVAYRLEAFDAEMANALHLIRRIRNSFAHDIYGCTLDAAPHSDRLRELGKRLSGDVLYQMLAKTTRAASESLRQFQTAIIILAVKLMVIARTFKLSRDMSMRLVQPKFPEDKK